MATAGPTQRAEGRCGWRRQIRVNGSNHAKSYHHCQRRGPFHVFFMWTSCVQGKGARMIGATADNSAGGPKKTVESLRDRFGCFEVVFGPNEWPIGSFERGDLKTKYLKCKTCTKKWGRPENRKREVATAKRVILEPVLPEICSFGIGFEHGQVLGGVFGRFGRDGAVRLLQKLIILLL